MNLNKITVVKTLELVSGFLNINAIKDKLLRDYSVDYPNRTLKFTYEKSKNNTDKFIVYFEN